MDELESENDTAFSPYKLAENLIERAKKCADGIPNITGKARFISLLNAEMKFLRRVMQKCDNYNALLSAVKCSNVPHLEAVASTLVSETDPVAVYRQFSLPSKTIISKDGVPFAPSHQSKVRIDIVADGGRRWVKVIVRNQQGLRAELLQEEDSDSEQSFPDCDEDAHITCPGKAPPPDYLFNQPPRIIRIAKSYLAAAAAFPVNYTVPAVIFKFARWSKPVESSVDHEFEKQLIGHLEDIGIRCEIETGTDNHSQPKLERRYPYATRDGAYATPDRQLIYSTIVAPTAVLDVTTFIGLVSDVSFLSPEARLEPSVDSCFPWLVDPASTANLLIHVGTLKANHPMRLQVEEEQLMDRVPSQKPLLHHLRFSLVPHDSSLNLSTTTYVIKKLVSIIGTIANARERARARGLFVPWSEVCDFLQVSSDTKSWEVVGEAVRKMVKERSESCDAMVLDGDIETNPNQNSMQENLTGEIAWLDIVTALTKIGDLETSSHFVLPTLFDPCTPPPRQLPHVTVVHQQRTSDELTRTLRPRSRQRGEDPNAIFEHAHAHKWAVVTANRREGVKWKAKGTEVFLHGARSLLGDLSVLQN
ncbi:hypothetical protein HDU93_005249 [Gonapodya sp. JEL0774]|nr:hypothetical protein HDU93_005249 [Gonapodya sp. JEL0774]